MVVDVRDSMIPIAICRAWNFYRQRLRLRIRCLTYERGAGETLEEGKVDRRLQSVIYASRND